MKTKYKENKGFTLIELVVVIAIIGILAVVAIPSLLKNIDKAKLSDIEADYNAIKSASLAYYSEGKDISQVRMENLYEYIEGELKTETPMGGNYQLYSLHDLNSIIPNTKPDNNEYWKGIPVSLDKGELSYGEIRELKKEESMFIGIRNVPASKERLTKLIKDLGEGNVYVYSSSQSYEYNIIYLKLIDFNK